MRSSPSAAGNASVELRRRRPTSGERLAPERRDRRVVDDELGLERADVARRAHLEHDGGVRALVAVAGVARHQHDREPERDRRDPATEQVVTRHRRCVARSRPAASHATVQPRAGGVMVATDPLKGSAARRAGSSPAPRTARAPVTTPVSSALLVGLPRSCHGLLHEPQHRDDPLVRIGLAHCGQPHLFRQLAVVRFRHVWSRQGFTPNSAACVPNVWRSVCQ